MDFLVEIRNKGGVLNLILSGRFDFSANKIFRHTCDEGMQEVASGDIEIDFRGVEYMDSSALGMLLLLKEKAEKERRTVTFLNCQETVREILDVVNFDKLFAIR